jgi:peptide/nickel transport system substrate-binding protein
MKKILLVFSLLASLSCSYPQQTLRIAASEGLISFDPHTQDEAVTMEILGNVYESLVAFDADMQLVPMLCTGYSNVDDRTWRFYLRPGVKFHDGKPLTAEDAIFSLERAGNHQASVFKSMLAVIEKIEKVDSLTIEISTVKPRPNLINILTMISIIPAQSDPAGQPVGTGPYSLAGFNGRDILHLNQFKGYWGEEPFFNKTEFHIIKDDSQRMEKLLSGKMDIDANVMENYRTKLSGDSRVNLVAKPGATITVLGLNTSGKFKDNPLSDVRLRQAISLAINRREMVARACHGYAVPANQIATQAIFGYDPELPEIEQNIEKARQIIGPLKTSDPIELTIKVSSAAWFEGQLLAEFLAPIGIKLTVDSLSWTELYSSIESGQAQFYLMGFAYSFGDASELLNDMVHSKGGARDFGIRNLSGYSNENLDKILEKADREFDPLLRKQLLQQAILLTTKDLPFIPLYIRDSSYGLRRDLTWHQKTAVAMLVKEIRL